jgi:hypothetical protein
VICEHMHMCITNLSFIKFIKKGKLSLNICQMVENSECLHTG